MDGRKARRIIALLLSLACLAERASQRSWPVRWLVLVLLRRAETASLDMLVEAVGVDRSHFEDPDAGFRPLDALLLAASLRTIAALLSAVVTPPPCADRGRIGRKAAPPAIGPEARPAAVAFAALPRGAFDTS